MMRDVSRNEVRNGTLTPGPFPRRNGEGEPETRTMASYPPNPLSMMERGSRKEQTEELKERIAI